MISIDEIKETVAAYDSNNIHVGIFGSHSAEEAGIAAKSLGMKTFIVCQKGREKLYTEYNKHLYDEVLLLDKFSELMLPENAENLVENNVILVPNRSFAVYCGYDKIENEFRVPLYGNRCLLRAEERTAPRNQYWLLEQAGIRMPKQFKQAEDIDRLTIVKVQQKYNPLERAFFYPSSYDDYVAQSSSMIEQDVIDEEGLAKAVIEEFALGPRFNANYQAYGMDDLFSRFDFVGLDDRIQTNIGGILNLPAKEQLKISVPVVNEEIGHKGVTMRESKKELLYTAAEKFLDAVQAGYPPKMIGLFALQGAMPYNPETKEPEFVVFDVSPRIPGCPCVGPTSPEMRRLSLKYGREISAPLDLSMLEMQKAIELGRLPDIVT
jgi:5-formaminoimidazole-4-carboxamide-1-(beta)-D-ribofuranosyl 5'-monophosphate synthetase